MRLQLWAREPADFLAGVGLLLVAPDAALAWGEYDAETSLDAASLRRAVLEDARDRAGEVDALVARAERAVAVAVAACQPDTGAHGDFAELRADPPQGLVDDAPDATSVDPSVDRAPPDPGEVRREIRRRKRELEAWASAMAAPRMGLDLQSGRQSIASAGARLAEALCASDVDALRDASAPQRRPLPGASLRLWHAECVPYALRATAPAGDVPRVRVAASWLAWRAITTHPLWGSRYATAPHPVGGRHFEWAPWAGALDLARWRATEGARPARWRSRIDRDKYGYGALSPAEPIHSRASLTRARDLAQEVLCSA